MTDEVKSESPGLPKIKDVTPDGSTTSIKSHDSGISMLPSISQSSPRVIHPGSKVKVKVMEPLQDKHICIVCSGILRNPVKFTACGHRCCLTCLAGLLQNVAECPIDQTTLDKKRVTLDDRVRKEVQILPVYCSNDTSGCKWRGTYAHLVPHLADCGYAVIRCPNKGCSEHMERQCMEKHARDDCPKFLTTCPHCKREVMREDVRKHSHSCAKRPMACPNNCGQSDLAAEKMTKHLEDECPKEVLPCPFVEAGCEFRNVRDVIRVHVTQNSDTHLNMVVDKLVAYRRSLVLHTDVIDDQTQRLASVESRVYALEKLTGTQLLWKIDKYSERLQAAKMGTTPTVYSPPFVSNKHGYKLMMSANLNGGGKARGKYLSTYVCLVPGDYDALLVWPFSHRVTFTLVAAGGGDNVSTSLKPSTCAENMPFLGRPGGRRNPSFGVETFVKLSTVADYIVDDCLYLSMKVDLMGMMVL